MSFLFQWNMFRLYLLIPHASYQTDNQLHIILINTLQDQPNPTHGISPKKVIIELPLSTQCLTVSMCNEEVYSEYTPVEQKRHKKHENDHCVCTKSFHRKYPQCPPQYYQRFIDLVTLPFTRLNTKNYQ